MRGLHDRRRGIPRPGVRPTFSLWFSIGPSRSSAASVSVRERPGLADLPPTEKLPVFGALVLPKPYPLCEYRLRRSDSSSCPETR